MINYRTAFAATFVLLLVLAAAFGTYYFQTVSTLNQTQTRDAYYQTQLQALQKQLNAIQSNSTLSRTMLTEQLTSIQSKIENLINGSQTKFSQQLAALMFEVNDVQDTLPCVNAQLIPAIHYNHNATDTVSVLLMNPASAMTVCVTWRATPIPNGTASYYKYANVHTLNFSLFEIVHNIPCTPACSGTLGVVSHSFVTITTPSHVPLNPYVSNFTTLYQITALGNSTGFYEQALPASACGRTPLVVGYKPSQVNTTDFFGYRTLFLCQAFPFGISRTMVSGFSSIVLLNFPYP